MQTPRKFIHELSFTKCESTGLAAMVFCIDNSLKILTEQ